MKYILTSIILLFIALCFNSICITEDNSPSIDDHTNILSISNAEPIVAVAYNPDGNNLLVASNNRLAVWNNNGTIRKTIEGKSRIRLIGYHGKEEVLFMSKPGVVSSLSIANNSIIDLFNDRDDYFTDLINKDNDMLFIAAVKDNLLAIGYCLPTRVSLWNISLRKKQDILMPGIGWIVDFEFSNNSNILWMISELGSVNKFDINAGKILDRFTFAPKSDSLAFIAFPTTIAVSPIDDSILLIGLADGRIIKCHIKTKEWLLLKSHRDEVHDVTFSSDGKMAASTSRDKTVAIWNVATGKLLNVLQGHKDHVLTVAFHPDCTQVLTGSKDGTARIWDVKTGREIVRIVFQPENNSWKWNNLVE